MRRAGVFLAHVVCAVLPVCGCAPDEPFGREDVDERVRELKALGQRGADAVPALLAALSDSDARIRHAAAVALTYADPTQSGGVHALARGLDSEDWYTRWEACLALKRIGPPARAAVPRLREALCDPESGIGREAALALVRIAPGDVEVADALLRVVQDDRPADRSAVIYALRKINVPVPKKAKAPPGPSRTRVESDRRAALAARRQRMRAESEGHYYNGEYDDHYVDGYDESETGAEAGLGYRTPLVETTADRLRARRSRVSEVLVATRAGDLAAILRKEIDAYFGFVPTGFAPREREVYRALRAQLERGLLPAATVRALGDAVWRPSTFGHALLTYGDVEARAFAATLLGHIEFDYYRATEALRRAGRDPAPTVRAAVRAARKRIEARRH